MNRLARTLRDAEVWRWRSFTRATVPRGTLLKPCKGEGYFAVFEIMEGRWKGYKVKFPYWERIEYVRGC